MKLLHIVLLLFFLVACSEGDWRSSGDYISARLVADHRPPSVIKDGLSYDVIQDDPAYAIIIDRVMDEVSKKNGPRQFGAIPRIWEETARLLWKRYGIVWRTPQELNPNVLFE
jgi:hypothetical protein